jgi:uracil-DNA glycosylase
VIVPEDKPYALSSSDERERRLTLACLPHMEPLTKYLHNIKLEQPDKQLPAFDPCDGGVFARALFLLEAPGLKAVNSTFISRNNPDPTAKNVCELLREADIARQDTLLWNIVPWYVGDCKKIRAVTKQEIEQALPYLEALLALLANLKAIVLGGKKAQMAKGAIGRFTKVQIFETYHPSARVFNVWPDKREHTRTIYKQVATFLKE